MNKDKLKAYMISMEKSEVDENVVKYEYILNQQDIDENATTDPDDLSHREASSEITDGLDRRIHGNKQNMVDVAEVDFSPTVSIQPGAVFNTGKTNLVVAAATKPFEFEGNMYIGISVNAPIYSSVEGLKEGDTFTFREKEYTIKSVE